MRVGIVCEGSTDFITISSFLEKSLKAVHIDAEFIDLHPGLDKSSEKNSGWSNALLWLEKNPLKSRKNNILGGGLFGGNLSWKKCDTILIQIDSDCLNEDGFSNFLKKRDFNVGNPSACEEKIIQVNNAILHLAGLSKDKCTIERHITCCAAHNSESWCIAALQDDEERMVEHISLGETNEIILHILSNYPEASSIREERRIKDRDLRQRFCNEYSSEFARVEARSTTYKTLVSDARALATG